MPLEENRSTTGLIGDVLQHVSNLVRKEVDLARAEIGQNVNRAGAALGVIAAGAVLVLVGLHVLAAALVAVLIQLGLSPFLASLIVGGILLIAAFIMIKGGLDKLKLSSLAPTRTADNVSRDIHAIKEASNG